MPIHSTKVDAAIAQRRVMRRRRLALALWALAVTPASGLSDELSNGSLTRNPFCDEPVDVAQEPLGVRLAGQNATVGQVRLRPIGQAVGLRDAGDAGLPRAVRSKVFVQSGGTPPIRSNPLAETSLAATQTDAPESLLPPVELAGTILDAGAAETIATDVSPENNDDGAVVFSFGDLGDQVDTRSSTPTTDTPQPFPMWSADTPATDDHSHQVAEGSTTESDTLVDQCESEAWSLADHGMFDPSGNVAIEAETSKTADEIDDIEPVVIRDAAPSSVTLELVETPEDASPLAREVADDINRLLRKHRHRMPVEVESMPMPQLYTDVTSADGGIAMAEDFTAALESGPETTAVDSATSGSENRTFAKWYGGSEASSPPTETPAALQAPVVSDPMDGLPESLRDLNVSDRGVVAELAVAPESTEVSASPKRLRLPEGMKLIPLRMNFAQVRSLTVGGRLKQVRVLDESVCQAVTAGDNQVKLIGTGNGVTQLVVWAELGEERTSKIQAFEVLVDSHEEAGTADESLDTLDQSIARAYPDCRVVLDHRGDHLVVRGQCPSERSAKSILRMVRRTCLIPVHDELKVR